MFILTSFDFETSNPPVRDSVNCILTCIRSKQIKNKKKEKKMPILDHSGVI